MPRTTTRTSARTLLILRRQEGLYRLVKDLSLKRYQRPTRQLVAEVEVNSSILEQMHEELGDVSGVHLTGVERDGAGKVGGAKNGHTVANDLLARLSESAVTALLGGQIDDDGAWPHRLDHFLGDEDWGTLSRDECRR